VVPVQASHPVGQAVIAEASKKNFGAAARQSPKVGPKQRTQLLTQAVIAVIAEFEDVNEVPTKYLPQPHIGAQSSKVAAAVQVHFTVS
jgi:hypothetical protein